MNDKKLNIDVSQVVCSDPRHAQVVRNLNIILPRVKAIGDRLGRKPCRALFTLKTDRQLEDDLVFPLGVPVCPPAWWIGKAVYQQRKNKGSGHVFEFATISDPAHVVLGETNDLTMHILVIIHAWMGHVDLFTNNIWHRETQPESVLQKFARDEQFVLSLAGDTTNWGWERYEYYADAAHALEMHCGEFPANPDVIPDDEHRQILREHLHDLQRRWELATTLPEKLNLQADMTDAWKQLQCHPIVPTTDICLFLTHPDNTKVPEEARQIMEIQRFQNRYSWQLIGRTKTMHEGWSHFWDRRFPLEPELDLIRIGMDRVIDNARYDTMHDAWPIYWYSDPYSLGEAIWEYIDQTHSVKLGVETVRFRRLKMEDNGDIVETDEWAERQVEKWDRSFMDHVAYNYDDTRFFYAFLTEDFFESLHKKALGWVRKMIMMINKTLKDLRWDPALVFEDERFPESLQDMYQVIAIWMNQLMMGQWMGFFGYGPPKFPVSEVVLWQMLQIIQVVAAYDQDKHEFKRQMLLRTGLFYFPNIKIVDTGRYNGTPYWTLRHEYDPDFGPLAQNDARWTLRYHWRYSGPVRLITMEILTDSWGRPWGPPRPYQYYTENGKTVKERWL